MTFKRVFLEKILPETLTILNKLWKFCAFSGMFFDLHDILNFTNLAIMYSVFQSKNKRDVAFIWLENTKWCTV